MGPLMLEIKARKLHPEATLPKSWSDQACGLDLHALLLNDQGRPNNAIVSKGACRAIPTGIAIECPRGYFAMVVSRSGLAKRGLFVTNSPGIIDPDYRGELHVLLYNGGYEAYYVKHGDRIAQLIVMPFHGAKVREVTELTETERGESGFGSTGR